MGLVYQEVRLANDAKDDLEEISVAALVDTGAITTIIPEHIANQLRLKQLYEREVTVADGRKILVPYVSPLRIEVFNRGSVSGALVMGDQVLLGAIAMEDMDLVVHPSLQKLTVNPENPNIAGSVAMSAVGCGAEGL